MDPVQAQAQTGSEGAQTSETSRTGRRPGRGRQRRPPRHCEQPTEESFQEGLNKDQSSSRPRGYSRGRSRGRGGRGKAQNVPETTAEPSGNKEPARGRGRGRRLRGRGNKISISDESQLTTSDSGLPNENKEPPHQDRKSKPTNFGLTSSRPSAPTPVPLTDPRTREIAQLERRYRSSFKRISSTDVEDVVSFDISPTDPDFPFEVSVITLQVTVPATYPAAKATVKVQLEDFPSELSERVTKYTRQKAENESDLSLLHLMNWLSRDLENVLRGKIKITTISVVKPTAPVKANNEPEQRLAEEVLRGGPNATQTTGGDANSSSQILEKDDCQATQDDSQGSRRVTAAASSLPKTGLIIKLANLSLSRISLLDLDVLPLTPRCTHCKTLFTSPWFMKPQEMQSGTCPRCKKDMAVRYFKQLVHAGNDHVGIVQTYACSVGEVIRVRFVPTCEECGQTASPMREISQGGAYEVTCRSCHAKMALAFSQIQMIVQGTSDDPALASLKSKRHNRDTKLTAKSSYDLLIQPGHPLPDNGRCKHYKRSYRWFRFPCCHRTYPCDDCHDETNDGDHEMEWATRMICGFCGREQPIKDDCSCGGKMKDTPGKGGFWEGGKGMRNAATMSRKDPRKGRLMKKQAEQHRKK